MTHVPINPPAIPVQPLVWMVLFCGLISFSCKPPSYPPPAQIVLPDGPEPPGSLGRRWEDCCWKWRIRMRMHESIRMWSLPAMAPNGVSRGIHPRFRLQSEPAASSVSTCVSFFMKGRCEHAREVLVGWQSALGVRLGESLRTALDMSMQPVQRRSFFFEPIASSKVRLAL